MRNTLAPLSALTAMSYHKFCAACKRRFGARYACTRFCPACRG